MKKENVRIKANISMQDKVDAIEYIASAYFTNDKDGNEKYTPYFADMAKVEAIVDFFLEGVEFENEDIKYDCIIGDEELTALVINIIEPFKYTQEISTFDFVMNNVKDKVEYLKEKHIAEIHDETNSAIAYKLFGILDKENEKLENEIRTTEKLEQWLDEQAEINKLIPKEKQAEFVKDFDIDKIMDSVVNKFYDSTAHEQSEELADAKNTIKQRDAKIIQLQNDYAKSQK